MSASVRSTSEKLAMPKTRPEPVGQLLRRDVVVEVQEQPGRGVADLPESHSTQRRAQVLLEVLDEPGAVASLEGDFVVSDQGRAHDGKIPDRRNFCMESPPVIAWGIHLGGILHMETFREGLRTIAQFSRGEDEEERRLRDGAPVLRRLLLRGRTGPERAFPPRLRQGLLRAGGQRGVFRIGEERTRTRPRTKSCWRPRASPTAWKIPGRSG